MSVTFKRSRIGLGEFQSGAAEVDVRRQVDIGTRADDEVRRRFHDTPVSLERVCPQLRRRLVLRKIGRRIREGHGIGLCRRVLLREVERPAEHRLSGDRNAVHLLGDAFAGLRDRNGIGLRVVVILSVMNGDGIIGQPTRIQRDVLRHAVGRKIPFAEKTDISVFVFRPRPIGVEGVPFLRRGFSGERGRSGLHDEGLVLHLLDELGAFARFPAHQVKCDAMHIPHFDEVALGQSVLRTAGEHQASRHRREQSDKEQSPAFHALPPSVPIA